MSALSTKGVCHREVWPYNPQSQPGNEGQNPPPPDAEESALGYRMPHTRSIAPNCVNHYKQVLSGADGLGGMPVVIASLVFNSWFRSAATHQFGKITMPLPGEQPLSGGHAMLIVGYQDDSSVPGGGYFIVRNSWGAEWATVSPEAPGHALMPYAYVERYVVEAFSGQSMAGKDSNAPEVTHTQVQAKASANTFEEKYVETLRREGRDAEGKLLPAGIRVIRHPDTPDEFMADTPRSRQLFEKRGLAWSDAARQSAFFPPRSRWSSDLQNSLNSAQQRCKDFTSAIDQNIRSSIGTPMPDVHLSAWLFALPYMPKIKKAEQVADLTDKLIDRICNYGHVPDGIFPPKDWAEALGGIEALRIYSVSGPFGRFHVVSSFVSPVRLSSSSQPELVQANAGILDAIQSLYDEWANRQPSVKFTFYTTGASLAWHGDMTGIASGDHWIALSASTGDGRWDTSSPPQFASRLYLRNFLDRLHPETRQQRISRIKDAVDRYVAEGYEGNILLGKIAKETGYRRTWVRRAFRVMQNSGHYQCYREGRQVAIRERTGRGGISLSSERGAFVRYHLGLLTSAIVGVMGWQCLTYATTGAFQTTGLLVVPLFLYAGKCIEITAKRNQSDL